MDTLGLAKIYIACMQNTAEALSSFRTIHNLLKDQPFAMEKGIVDLMNVEGALRKAIAEEFYVTT